MLPGLRTQLSDTEMESKCQTQKCQNFGHTNTVQSLETNPGSIQNLETEYTLLN